MKNIKLIDDYTKKEILALKTEDVERIIKITLANEGIKLPKAPIEPNYTEVPAPDKKMYFITGFSLFFEKREPAEEIVKILRENFSQLKKTTYRHFDAGAEITEMFESLSEDWTYRKGPSSIIIEEKYTYSTELYQQVKDKMDRNKELKKIYNQEKEEYDKASTEAAATIDYVWNKVNEVRNEQDEKDRKLRHFKEYLELAENNVDIAWKFMRKAYTVSQDEEDYINSNYKK